MTATVIPFPSNRQTGKIRKVADTLLKRAGGRTQGDGYWRQTIDKMAERMDAAGVDADTIDRELVAFRDAVAAEMSWLGQPLHQHRMR